MVSRRDFLRSGLHLDAADPRDVARMIRETEEARKLLRRSGLRDFPVPPSAGLSARDRMPPPGRGAAVAS